MSDSTSPRVWEPSAATISSARLTDYREWLAQTRDLRFDTYDALWRWSTADLEAFWRSIWDYFAFSSATPLGPVLAKREMPGAQWFPGATLNYVDRVFHFEHEAKPAIVFQNEAGGRSEIGYPELKRQVAALAATLRGFGVGQGDRVVAYMPNIPETVVAFLAVASIGAVWSVCSPDMGPVAVLDRFRQVEPKVLIAVDGYRWGGRAYDRRETVADLVRGLPTLHGLVLLPSSEPAAPLVACPTPIVSWSEALAPNESLAVTALPFDHPLWIVYSSGTTGLPKAIVHGHGGILLEHVKLMALHNDLGPRDRYHWYSSTGWIMWNCQIAGLLVGSTICLYDGNPAWPDHGALWRFVGEAGVTFFGAGAAYFTACLKAGIEPRSVSDLSKLRAVGSTGSPLPPESYRWIRDRVGSEIWLTPISGGTDFASAFVAGAPILPVYEGEMQCRCLGARVEAFDDAGQPLIGQVGELVCTTPIPSMPLFFWNDDGNRRYHESYFDTYPGVWRHGDWVLITERGGAVIYGRSDTTINRHGIRMGTSELYRAVEDLPEVVDSLVVDLEYLGRESFMPLFVVLRDGMVLSPELEDRIRSSIRSSLSSRHIPNAILQVADVPRTLSGKKMELPVKKLLLGMPLDAVANRDSMANPQSLEWYVHYARQRREEAGGRRV